jgi:hypothetical protein
MKQVSGSFLKKRTKKLLVLGAKGGGGRNAHGPAKQSFFASRRAPAFCSQKEVLPSPSLLVI